MQNSTYATKSCTVELYAEKSFRNLVKSNRNQIIFTIFRLIWNQTDVHSVPNQRENGKYNLISLWSNKISLCESLYGWIRCWVSMQNILAEKRVLFSCQIMRIINDRVYNFPFIYEINGFFFNSRWAGDCEYNHTLSSYFGMKTNLVSLRKYFACIPNIQLNRARF